MRISKKILAALLFILISMSVYGTESDNVNTSSEDFETSNYEDEIYE